MIEIDFDEYFKILMIATKMLKVHPNTQYDIYIVVQIILALSLYTLYFLILVNCIVNYDLKDEDYFNTIRNIVPIAYYMSSVLSYFMLINNRKFVGQLINHIKKDYRNLNKMDIKSRDVIYNYARRGSWIVTIILFVAVSCLIIFIMKSVIISVIDKVKGEYSYVPLHKMYYPKFIHDRKQNNILLFIATYIGEMNFVAITGAILLCTSPFGPISMLHACGQLELVKMKFEKLFEKDNINESLNDIVKDLQNIYGFIENIKSSFWVMYEVLLKETTLIMSLSSFTIYQSLITGSFSVEYVFVFLGCFFVSGFLCYHGDLLMAKGEEVREAAYGCGWERVFDPRARKKLLIILTRAQRPTAISPLFCIINLDTLANVYSTSYTIFNLMTAIDK